MADEQATLRSFRKFSYRGVDLEQLLEMKADDVSGFYMLLIFVLLGFFYNLVSYYCFFNVQLTKLVHCRARRRFNRGLKRKPMTLIKRLRKSKKDLKENVCRSKIRPFFKFVIMTNIRVYNKYIIHGCIYF